MLNEEIIFRDGWTLDTEPVTDEVAANAFDNILLGYRYGLKLTDLYIDSEMIHFEWRGTKQAVKDWYIYVSVNMLRESEEVRNETLFRIINK